MESLFQASLDQDFGADEVTQHREALLGFAAQGGAVAHRGGRGRKLAAAEEGERLASRHAPVTPRKASRRCAGCAGTFPDGDRSQPEHERRLLAACAVCVQEGCWLPLAAQIAELSEDEADAVADRLVHCLVTARPER